MNLMGEMAQRKRERDLSPAGLSSNGPDAQATRDSSWVPHLGARGLRTSFAAYGQKAELEVAQPGCK